MLHRRGILKGIGAAAVLAAAPPLVHASGFSVGAGYSAEAVAFFNRLSTPLGPTVDAANLRAKQYDILFRSLVSSGVWPLLDALGVLAAADEPTAKLNLASSSHSLTAVNSPAFVADRGYTGDGSTSCLTGPNLATFGGQYALNDCHMGVFVGTTGANATGGEIGHATGLIRAKGTSTAVGTRANDGTSTVCGAVTTAIGHTMWSRSLSTAYAVYRNGVLNASPTVTTTSITSAAMRVCGSGATFSPFQCSAWHVGKSMTAAQAGAMSVALATYLQSVGAPTA